MKEIKEQQDIFVSVVCVVQEVKPSLVTQVNDLKQVLTSSFKHHEIILIDNSSRESVHEALADMFKQTDGLRVVRVTRALSLDNAFTAGLDLAIGDFVVTFSLDVDPLDMIPNIVAAARMTKKVVVGQRMDISKDGFFFSLGRDFFYWFCEKVLYLELPRHTTYFMAINRVALSLLQRSNEKFRMLKTMTAFIGVPISVFPYQQVASATSTRSLFESAKLSVDVVVSQSTLPLRLLSFILASSSIVSFVGFCYVVIVFLLKEDVQQGWATLMGLTTLSMTLLFFAMAVLSEYLNRCILEMNDRPSYFILEDVSSTKPVSSLETRNLAFSSESQEPAK